MSTYRLVAFFEAKPTLVPEVKEILKGLATKFGKQPKNISVNLTQNASNDAMFAIIEEWSDKDAIDAHMVSDDVKQSGELLAGKLASEPNVDIFKTLQ